MEYVKSFRYIDDLQYAMDYLNCYAERKSIKKIEMDLMQKGISRAIWKQALVAGEEEGGGQDEMTMIKELLQKKHYSSDMDVKEKRKIYGFLLRKGYSAEAVMEAMRM